MSDEREQLIDQAMALTERLGQAATVALLANDTGRSRTAIERHFASDSVLFDAVADRWYKPDIAMMEDVVASDLPIARKLYEFFARRFIYNRGQYRRDPQTYTLYLELGDANFEQVRGYIDLADHYLAGLISQAQAEGHFEGLSLNRALSLINQAVICYTSPQLLVMLDERLAEDKLAAIIDTLLAALTSEAGSCNGTVKLSSI